jgi:hypothetical protein
MPRFSDTPNLTLEDSIIQIISSIAMEELALSHIINAEGEKLQYVLGTLDTVKPPPPPPTVDKLLEVNESVKDMLGTITMNQMFLLGKLAAAMNAYAKLKDGSSGNSGDGGDGGDGGGDGGDGGNGGDTQKQFPLKEGPYDTRVDESDWDYKTFSLMMRIQLYYGVPEPEIEIYDAGSVKLADVLKDSDFSGISVRALDPELSKHFSVGIDKVGDPAIIYDYYPALSVWRESKPHTPVVEQTLILSKDGYEDAQIRVILRYNGSLMTEEF